MTIEEIKNSDKIYLTCNDVSQVLHSNPATLHKTASERPERLGFRVCVAGNRVRIPRIPFLQFLGLEPARNEDEEQSA